MDKPASRVQPSSTDAAADAFLQDAGRELAELMAEVSGEDHDPMCRTSDQERALLDARLGAVQMELAEIEAELDAL
jgi:hypothetical protein